MLQELCISNLALIDKARVQFGLGLNILTGETGAGKTVVVGAVNLLLGGRADASLVRRGSKKAEVQGLFSIPPGLREENETVSDLIEDEEQIIIRRVISADGKNKCYVNDRMVTVGTLADIGRRLLDLHGQHEHQSLFKTSTHVDFLDKYGGKGLLDLRAEYHRLSAELRSKQEELKKLRGAERELLGKRDLLQFQISEIDKAALSIGEDEELVKEREILRNAEKLYSGVAGATSTLTENGEVPSATELIARAVGELQTLSGIDADLDEMAERLNSLLIEAEDCASSLRDYMESLDFPPGRLQEVEDRLALLSLLKKKYGSTIDEILLYRDKAASELEACYTSGERIESLEAEVIEAEEALIKVALKQSEKRKMVAEKFVEEVIGELSGLNMPNARFDVSFTRELDDKGLHINGEDIKLFPNGLDKIEFMVSANKGEPIKPLVKIASGGEISRVMLALKIVLADADEVPTLIFDEVDVGIGGKTAKAVAQKLSILGSKHQVLAVTHLPQIASFADKHFSILKKEQDDRTITEIEELLDRNRINEMARLLSGNTESDLSIKHAEELILEAQRSKHGLVNGRLN